MTRAGGPMLALAADCLPIALARANGGKPALAVLHAGWRGLLAGIVAAGVRALASRDLAAAIGPSIGPCCYEVGDEVAVPVEVRGLEARDEVPRSRDVAQGRAPP